jgi:hypothetical protein
MVIPCLEHGFAVRVGYTQALRAPRPRRPLFRYVFLSALPVQLLISRLTGNLGTSLHLSGYPVN